MKELEKNQFLEFLKEINPEKIIYISPEDFPDFTENLSERIQEVAFKRGKSETGAIILDESFLVIPPFPVEKTFEGDSTYLFDLLKRNYTLAVILLRLGEYSLGVFDGDDLVVHKTGTQFISAKIRAGGQSAARFSRVREGQINDFFKKVCSQVKEKILPWKDKIDFVFFGGDSKVVKSFINFCEHMKDLESKIMSRVLNARHMKLETLKNILNEVWKFRIYET
ncbi:MAG: hypothetical protein J7L45_00955 [Candidatus Aenigmarchaeota archaeon]|nr:hypothetical protein [Candidatus Aenigmarchaeota archaeon]